MRNLLLTLIILILESTTLLADSPHVPIAVGPAAPAVGAFSVLTYHEVREIRDYADPFTVNPSDLAKQFAWLRGDGYTPVSLNKIVDARMGGKPLPAKAVVLSFDDAYLSFYTHVYPLLQEYDFPALLGVVGIWIDNPLGVPVLYGEKGTKNIATFASWSQLREMADSGLVEIASHTYDLHRGVLANPQGNLQPAATSRIYDAVTGRYEDDASWRKRVYSDISRSISVIERETGHRPRTIVWPYGRYNDELLRMSGEMGISISLTLNDGKNSLDVPLTTLRRTLLIHNPSLAEFSNEERGPLYPEPVRVVQVSLDDLYNADQVQQERNLSTLLDRINILRPSHVYLQAISDINAENIPVMTYFPNRHLPVRSDLFNRVAWQLASRDSVKVFAVLPVTGFRLPEQSVIDIYEDLARHATFAGIVFDTTKGKRSPDKHQNAAVIEFTRKLAARVRAIRAPMETVGTVCENPGSEQFEQELSAMTAAYDYVALMPNPAENPKNEPVISLLKPLSEAISRANDPVTRQKLVFMLNSHHFAIDANRAAHNEESGKSLALKMRNLQLRGILNFGYGPDDFLHNNPPLEQIAPAISLRIYPLTTKSKER